jgi:hypothetical protein
MSSHDTQGKPRRPIAEASRLARRQPKPTRHEPAASGAPACASVAGRGEGADGSQRPSRAPVLRAPLTTVSYDEVPLRAAPMPAPSPARAPLASAPSITVTETPIGLRTLTDIKEHLEAEAAAARERAVPAPIERACVLELQTFVVLDGSLQASAGERERMAFVEERLLARLPFGIQAVRRIDVRPADESALLVRVWSEVPALAPGR